MKTISIAVLSALLFTGCIGKTDKGECIGLLDDKVPGLKYDLSYWNVFVAVLFSETVIVPVIVVAKDLQCPE